MIRVFLADDHAVVRRGIQSLLETTGEMTVIATASDGREVLQSPLLAACEVLVLDLSLPRVSGSEVLRQVHARLPALPVLILSMYPEDQHGLHLLREGAAAYLSKDRSPEELIAAIRALARGERYLTDLIAGKALHDHDRAGPPHERLTAREHQVFLLIIQGRTVAEIAAELDLHSSTVSNNLRQIKAKLGACSLGELVGYAHRAGLAG
ncbi:MAG: response regulator transcription factor [Myxococcales bacterium]|nr:MAG: response regulator transcription factor [Myxococcales bacterium]